MSNVVAEIEASIPALRRYASSLLRDQREVDDLVRDCLARALGRMLRRQPDTEVRPWLFAILHNLLISRMAAQKRAHRQSGPVPGPDDDGPGQRALAGGWRRALNALPETQRCVPLLVTVEDFSYADAARVTGVPVATVIARLAQARENLRRSVEQPTRTALRRVK